MNAQQLFKAGKIDAAVEALGVELRDNPMDFHRRTFLFELLCFAGNYSRAEKQLDILAKGSRDAEMGALLYRSALHAEQLRQEMFGGNTFPSGAKAPPVSGTFNGRPFSSLTDADPRIGARMELFVAGQYTLIPFEQLASVKMEPPTKLRDLLWPPALVRTAEHYVGLDLGEVITPALAPLTWQDTEDVVRLGRLTEWVQTDDGAAVPIGQKLLLIDGEEVPILELRELIITPSTRSSS
jgi:type VI secretion system protein ImpE